MASNGSSNIPIDVEPGVALIPAQRAQPIVARSFDEVRAVSTFLADPREGSTLLPMHLRGSAASTALIIMRGAEVGLPPVAAMGLLYMTPAGRIGMEVKAKLAICMSRDLIEDLKEVERTPLVATYEVKRRGRWSCRRSYTIEEARAAGLVKDKGGAWVAQPANMLQWRALGLCLDFLFPDLIAGLGDEYDADDRGAPTPAQFSAPPPSAAPAPSAPEVGTAPTRSRARKPAQDAQGAPPTERDAAEPVHAAESARAQQSPTTAADAFATARDEMEAASPPAKPWPRSEGTAPPAQPFASSPAVPESPPQTAPAAPAQSTQPDAEPQMLADLRAACDAVPAATTPKSKEDAASALKSIRDRFLPWTTTVDGAPWAEAAKAVYVACRQRVGV